MNFFAQARFYLRSLFQKRKLDEQLSAEIQTHIDLANEANLAKGMTPEEARYAALREFGNVANFQEHARDGRGWVWLEQTGQDFRYAVRQLQRSPGFAAVAILSLALAIGANTAIFSLYHEVMVKPLRVSHPDELVHFRWIAPVAGFKHMHPVSGWRDPTANTKLQTSTSFSLLSFEWFRDYNQVFTDVFAFAPLREVQVRIKGITEISDHSQMVSGGYFRSLGVQPAAGRLLTEDDDRAGAAPVVVISDRYWRQRFGRDPAVTGQAIDINGVPCTIVGVTAAGFSGTLQVGESPDVFIPLARVSEVWPQIAFFMKQPWRFWFVQVMGRLRPGVSAVQARASLEDLFQRSALDDTVSGPATTPTNTPAVDAPQLELLPGGRGLSHMRGLYAQPLLVLQALAAMLLLIACLNVANLLLARGAARRREIATRLALGAGRGRIVRQLLGENILIAGGGTILGLGLAWWGRDLLVAMHALGQEALVLQPRFDWTVIGFAVGAASLTTLLFGLIPAWQATRLDLRTEFSGGMRGPARPALRLGSWLMVLQVALSLMLLVGAGLLARTLHNLRQVDIGFNRERLLQFRLDASGSGNSPAQLAAVYKGIADEIKVLPGVESLAYASVPVLSDARDSTNVTLEGDTSPQPRTFSPMMNVVTRDFFDTLQLSLRAGRSFGASDTPDGLLAVVINDTLARDLPGGGNPVGRRLVWHGKPMEIVGVVNDASYADVREPKPPTLYFAFAQNPPDPRAGPGAAQANFIVRSAGEIDLLVQSLRENLRAHHPDLPLIDVRTQVQQIDRQLAQQVLFARLSGAFGSVVALLVGIGLYGLISYAVLRRTGEIGIRMALGAQSGDVLRMILRDSLGLVVLGVLIGSGGALAAGRYLASRLYGLSATDAPTYAAVGGLMLAVAALASCLPARRAAKVDPVIALRAE